MTTAVQITPNGMKEFLGRDWERMEERIRSSLKSDIELLNSTNEAILSHGGKRLRPLVSLLVARACSGGVATDDSIRFAAASELLHNATLLHDDVADDSRLRRGAPTVMSLLGGTASVLIGDYWLVKAMESILESPSHSEEVIRIFSKTLSDLAQGEMLQLQKATKADTTEEDYLRIIYSKTASLFEATALSAAISVDAPPEFLQAVREYSIALGMAFQIKDDILDYAGDSSVGKPLGVDLNEGKITLPLLGALGNVSGEEADAVRKKVTLIPERPGNIAAVREFVLERGGVEYAALRLNEYTLKAVRSLDALPYSKEKDYLAAIAEYTARRDK